MPTARELITRAFKLSGIVSKDLQTVSGSQLYTGLMLLNEILDDKAFDTEMIPYYTSVDLNAVQGQEKYFIANLVDPETLTFNIGNVRFSVDQIGRKKYFGSSRVDGITSLPFKWHFERCLEGSYIYLYFLPADAYQLKIWGKFAFNSVTADTELSTLYDAFYLKYLRYELAPTICDEYQIPVLPQVAQKLEDIRIKLRNVSAPDLTVKTRSRFGTVYGSDPWAAANLYKGFTPNG